MYHRTVTPEQMKRICGEVLPGEGNLPHGDPKLESGSWIVPFKRKGFGWQTFLPDRPIENEMDHNRAVAELRNRIRQALRSSDENPY